MYWDASNLPMPGVGVKCVSLFSVRASRILVMTTDVVAAFLLSRIQLRSVVKSEKFGPRLGCNLAGALRRRS